MQHSQRDKRNVSDDTYIDEVEHVALRRYRRACDWCEQDPPGSRERFKMLSSIGGKPFWSGPKRYFCSSACRDAFRAHEKALLASYREEHPQLCEECNKPMPGRRDQEGYCSTACRMRAYRRRKREA